MCEYDKKKDTPRTTAVISNPNSEEAEVFGDNS